MTGERVSVDERAEAYLEGELTRDEAAAFERDLAGRPEVADALGAAIVLRDLLGQLPPLQPPPGLEQRILAALGRRQQRSGERLVERADRPAAVSPLRAALNGASWLVRPSAAAMHGGLGGVRPLAVGLGQVRWLLGPLAARRSEVEPAPRRQLWRRVIGRLGGLG